MPRSRWTGWPRPAGWRAAVAVVLPTGSGWVNGATVDDLPPGDRPDVYVYGESLGAFVGQAAVRQVPHGEVCGVLWSGAPGAGLTGHPHERSLLQADDPIRYLKTDTAYQRPEGWPTVWLPLLRYATTWLDTSASLRPSPRHGHQYGAEQNWALPRC